MNKINEQIKKIHEQMKQRGEWDGLPDVSTCHEIDIETTMDDRNAYIAQKLDLITESVVLAMRARRDGERAGSRWNIGMWEGNNTRDCHALYVADHLGSYESILALALIRTMDLMGFYGVEGKQEFNKGAELADCIRTMRRILLQATTCSERLHYGGSDVDWYLGQAYLNILRIAELDKIDIQWHIDARLKYESGVK